MRNLIIGTAGHIDHGKTTLIKNLTGFETDTLPEEAKRGMTINLGFAYYTLPTGKKVGVIDVPGHEKFIKNMVAGATGIDFILLVIACDDGIMPQTIEHAHICEILGIKKGAVILTKRDLVNDERAEEIKEDIKEIFKDSFIASLPILEVSSKNTESFENLKSFLNESLDKIDIENELMENFRMSIDRVFSVKGFGTVVTGTTISGEVKEGDTLYLYPSKKEVKVKGIQNHGVKVISLGAGNRCALNLHGADVSDIHRGDLLSKDSSMDITDRIDCLFTKLNSGLKVKNNARIRLHLGTLEVLGRIKLLEVNEITDSKPVFAQIELETPTVAVAGDIGVIRNYSPLDTIGGIKILSSKAVRTKKNNEEYISRLKSLAFGDDSEKIISLLNSKKNTLLTLEEISRELGKNVSKDSLENLVDNKKIIKVLENPNLYLSWNNLELLSERISSFLTQYHENFPLKKGIQKSELKNRQFNGYSPKEFNGLLTALNIHNTVETSEDIVYLKDFKVKLNKNQKKIKDDILTIYKKLGFSAQFFDKVISDNQDIISNKEDFFQVHNYLVENGLLVSVAHNKYVMRGFYTEAEKILREYFLNNGKITLKEYKDLLNISRNEALVFLEKFDSLGITSRIEDYRILKK